MLRAAWSHRLVDAVPAFGATQRFEAAVDALVEVRVDVELLLVYRFRLVLGPPRWCLGRWPLRDLLDLDAGVEDALLLGIDQDAGGTVVVEHHLLVLPAVLWGVLQVLAQTLLQGAGIGLPLDRSLLAQVPDRCGVDLTEAASHLTVFVAEFAALERAGWQLVVGHLHRYVLGVTLVGVKGLARLIIPLGLLGVVCRVLCVARYVQLRPVEEPICQGDELANAFDLDFALRALQYDSLHSYWEALHARPLLHHD